MAPYKKEEPKPVKKSIFDLDFVVKQDVNQIQYAPITGDLTDGIIGRR
jgi:hypothetical protein